MAHITSDILLKAYASGIFPMAENASDPGLFWVEPDFRGILPLNGFHVSRSLAKRVRQQPFEIRVDHDFRGVMAGCAEAVKGRPSTWINDDIKRLYGELFDRGFCHSVECWQNDQLVGGLYGVSIGAAFFGESMFSRQRDASKVALVHLVARLRAGNYRLLDAQFINDHLVQFGAAEIDRSQYQSLLESALQKPSDFAAFDRDEDPVEVLAIATKQPTVENSSSD